MSLQSNIFLQKEELTKWKKDLITNLSVRDYYKRAERQLGLTELTVNSCFFALSLFKYLKYSV